jgi:hypothetical protein
LGSVHEAHAKGALLTKRCRLLCDGLCNGGGNHSLHECVAVGAQGGEVLQGTQLRVCLVGEGCARRWHTLTATVLRLLRVRLRLLLAPAGDLQLPEPVSRCFNIIGSGCGRSRG